MDYYNYLINVYGIKSAEIYLEILKTPVNENQLKKDKIAVLKLIDEMDKTEKKEIENLQKKLFYGKILNEEKKSN